MVDREELQASVTDRVEKMKKEMLASENPVTRAMAWFHPYVVLEVESKYSIALGLRDKKEEKTKEYTTLPSSDSPR